MNSKTCVWKSKEIPLSIWNPSLFFFFFCWTVLDLKNLSGEDSLPPFKNLTSTVLVYFSLHPKACYFSCSTFPQTLHASLTTPSSSISNFPGHPLFLFLPSCTFCWRVSLFIEFHCLLRQFLTFGVCVFLKRFSLEIGIVREDGGCFVCCGIISGGISHWSLFVCGCSSHNNQCQSEEWWRCCSVQEFDGKEALDQAWWRNHEVEQFFHGSWKRVETLC